MRKQGAVPATIGVVGGRVKVGLRDEELERLADWEGNKGLVKVSRRDIGPIIGMKKDGGTTIAATLIFAHLAGIRVFATGGLGGVHRGAENSMDISADLHELTRCSVGLVSCGVKSILDIGRTLEYLETLGVPVLTYGKDYNFPAFFCGRSEFETNWKVDDPRAAAEILEAQRRLGLTNGTLFALPMPEEYAASGEEVRRAVDQAVRESEENGMSKKGKEVTPWLLSRVVELTGGKSLENNLALLRNASVVGGKIAVELAKLEAESHQEAQHESKSYPTDFASSLSQDPSKEKVQYHDEHKKSERTSKPKAPPKLIIVGGSAVDITANLSQPKKGGQYDVAQTTVPGTVSISVGGVARNIAEAAHRVLSSSSSDNDKDNLEEATLSISPVGSDSFAGFLRDEHTRLGMRDDGFLKVRNERTAVCNVLLDSNGGLVNGVADMDITRNVDSGLILKRLRKEKPDLVVMDGNISSSTLSSILQECNSREKPIPTFFEPTSVPKSSTILTAILDQLVTDRHVPARSPVTFVSPNTLELAHLYREADSESMGLLNHRVWWDVVDSFNLGSEWRMDLDQLARQPVVNIKEEEKSQQGEREKNRDLSFLVKDGIAQMAVNLLPFFQHIIIKCGERGVITVFRISGKEDVNRSSWVNERSNPLRRYVVARGTTTKTGSNGEEKEPSLIVLKHYPAIPLSDAEIVNVTGAGDSLVGSLSASIVQDPTVFLHPDKLDEAIHQAQKAAVMSLHSVRAVSPLLGKQNTSL